MKCSKSLISLLALATASFGATRDWITTGTDTITHSVTLKSLSMQALAADSGANLSAVWTEQVSPSQRRVMFARRPAAGTWTEPEALAETANACAVIAVERRSGFAHIAWTVQYGSAADVFYATNRTGQWVTTRMTDDSLEQWLPTIALEADTIPNLAWITLDSSDTYHIACARRAGAWRTQVLSGSQLGGFGSGANPWLAIEPGGTAHITYRGGDYGTYHIHHAQNAGPGDTAWTYEILESKSLNDFSSAIAAADSGELHLVCSGNDGWGYPFRTCYLHRPPNSTQWDSTVLMTASASAAMRGFAMDGNDVHATWERINGNLNTEEIFHVSNSSGLFYNSAIRDDGRTSFGAIAIDPNHCGHGLVLVDSAVKSDSQQVFCVHNEPFTAVAEPDSRNLPGGRRTTILRLPGRIALPGPADDRVDVYDASGRDVRTLVAGVGRFWDGSDRTGHPVAAGSYLLIAGNSTKTVVILK